MKVNKSSLLYGTFFLTAVNLVSQTLAFFYRIALTRIIGAENIGLYQLLMPVYVVITSFCYSGLTVAVSKLVAEKSAIGAQGEINSVLNSALKLFIAVSVVVSAAVYIFSGSIANGFVGDGRTQKALIVLLPCMILTGIENISKNYFYGINNVKIPAVMEIFEQIIRITAVIALLLIFYPSSDEDSVMLIAVGMVICEIFSAITLTFLRKHHLKKGNFKCKKAASKGIYKRLLMIAIPVCATNLSGSLMDSVNSVIIPRRLVASGLSAEEALESFGSLFGMSMPLFSLPTVFVGALCLIIVPSLSTLVAEEKHSEVKRKISKIFTSSITVTLPVTAFIIPISPYLNELLFGYREIESNTVLLAVATVLGAVQAISASVAYGLGKQRPTTFSFILGDYIQVAFTYFLVSLPSLRLNGYVLGLIASILVTVTINFVIILKTSGMRFQLYDWLLKPVFASLAVYFIATYSVSFFQKSGYAMLPAIIAVAIFCAIIYLALFKLLGKAKAPYRP